MDKQYKRSRLRIYAMYICLAWGNCLFLRGLLGRTLKLINKNNSPRFFYAYF